MCSDFVVESATSTVSIVREGAGGGDIIGPIMDNILFIGIGVVGVVVIAVLVKRRYLLGRATVCHEFNYAT